MFPIPKGDILIHTGDFSYVGDRSEILDFKNWFDSQPHAGKIFIAGNHELSLDTPMFVNDGYLRARKFMSKEELTLWSEENRKLVAEPPSNYLEHSPFSIVVNENNVLSTLNVFGSPYQPEFYNWAFNLDRNDGSLERRWSEIPSNTDILLTHGPPFGILDELQQTDGTVLFAGCSALLKEVKDRVKPRIHAFGHLHDTYGTLHDGTTLFINACTCTEEYKPENKPIVVDLPLDSSLPAVVVPLEQQEF